MKKIMPENAQILAREISLGGVVTTTDFKLARMLLLHCRLNGDEISNIPFTFPNLHEKGEEFTFLPITSQRTFLSFDAYKKSVTLLRWRNKARNYKPDGAEEVTVKNLIREYLQKEYGGIKEQDSVSVSPFKLCINPSVDDDLVRYISPSVLVSAGLRFGLQVSDGKKAFGTLASYFAGLKSGFYTRFAMGKPAAYLLDGVFEVKYDDNNTLWVCGIEECRRISKSGVGYQTPKYWKGRACDLANFIDVVEKAFTAVGGTPVLFDYMGATYRGLNLLFYVNFEARQVSDVDFCPTLDLKEPEVPYKAMGMIHHSSKTRIYAGDELPLEMVVAKEW